MDVINIQHLLEEKLEVVPFCETRELRDVVQADINDPLRARQLD